MCYCLNHCVWAHSCPESPLNKPHEPNAASAMIVDSFEIVQEKKPHVCPVCRGTGEVVLPYTKVDKYGAVTGKDFDECRACKGACVLWG